MEYNVAQLMKEPVGSIRQVEVCTAFIEFSDIKVDKIDGQVRFMRTDLGIWAKGRFQVEVASECSRCLEGYILGLTMKIDEQYYPVVNVNMSGASLSDSMEEGSFTLDINHVLHLGEALRQGIVATFPLKPLCSDNCRGICPQCGIDLNYISCACVKRNYDSRWTTLHEKSVTGDNAG
ncbi:DUF177 domain-containing protein [SAR202 cluster bacterium AD-802-E10_MRT_200m]|nr:DUF177 domain-containing protein [SAR202 cluster bacterium AD-802-E10_MRT_200m]